MSSKIVKFGIDRFGQIDINYGADRQSKPWVAMIKSQYLKLGTKKKKIVNLISNATFATVEDAEQWARDEAKRLWQ